MSILFTPGTIHHSYKGGFTVSWDGNLEQCRLAAEIHAKNQGQDSIFRFFRRDTGRFCMAYAVVAGKVLDHPDVSIPAETW